MESNEGQVSAECAGLRDLRRWCAEERCSRDWIMVAQARIDAFAEVTEDRYWLHTDPQRARGEGPFDGTIAHGFLLLSLTVGDALVTETTDAHLHAMMACT